MKNKCFDIGVLQGFVDGELANSVTENVIRHLAVCETCPLVLADLESQNELVFAALDAEHNVLVPTERLRAKVFASIREFESTSDSSGFWKNWLAGPLSFVLQPGFAAVAGVLLLAALFSIGYRILNQPDIDIQRVAINRNPETVGEIVDVSEVAADPRIDTKDSETDTVTIPPPAARAPEQSKLGSALPAVYRNERSTRTKTVPKNTLNENVVAPVRSSDLDAEEGYLTTIATLSRTVNENKDYVLRPSERVAYERNLAVVDDAIKKMKGEVRNDPNNSAAREVLRSSYKNKIDLLNSVADRTEMVASLK